MKNILITSLVMTTLFSCTKSDTPPPPKDDSTLKSIVMYSPVLHVKEVVSFDYDQNSQIATLRRYGYDSSVNPVTLDSAHLSFTPAAAGSFPGEYDLNFFQTNPSASQTEHHFLTYDPQNRVSRDSVGINTTGNYTTQHFTYDDWGNTTIEQFAGDPQTPGSYTTLVQIDTMYVQENNLYSDYAYTGLNGSGLIHYISRNFSTENNPVYNGAWSNSLGALLNFNSLVDFRSKNLPSYMSYQDDSFNTIALNFVWTSDAAGRVIRGIGTDTNSGLVGETYTFNY
jgi:hypothetical protein